MTVKSERTAVYPGTFDPVTNGHMSLIERASRLFDKVIVAVVENSQKKNHFDINKRVELMNSSVSSLNITNIEVTKFEGLLADYAQKVGACAIIRGLRAISDFEYEFQMALMNRKIARDVETVFLMPALSWVYLSSSLVKELARNGVILNAKVRQIEPPSKSEDTETR